MNASLTPFQLWTLFLLYKNSSDQYTVRDLLLECCDSAMNALSTGRAADAEISSLQSAGYIVGMPLVRSLDENRTVYQISNHGILYVRKSLASIQDASSKGAIPESVISAQDGEVAEALRAKSLSIANTIVDCAVKNIGHILALLKACENLGG